MAHLTKLPTELLWMVANSGGVTRMNYSCEILNHKDLANLARVNRRLHDVINPVLYNSYGSHAARLAVCTDNLSTLKVAHSHGLDLDRHDVLHLACAYGRYEIVKWLLDHGARLEETVTREPFGPVAVHYTSALRAAMYWSREDIALLLLSRGANPYFILPIIENDWPTEELFFTSALHYAAETRMLQVVEYLVRKTALPVDLQDYDGASPLFHLLRDTPDDWHLDRPEEWRLEEAPKSDCPYSNIQILEKLPLTVALETGKYSEAEVLLDAGAKVKPCHPEPGVHYPIHTYIRARAGEFKDPARRVYQKLVQAGADLEERYEQGYTPLEEAILHGTPDVVLELLAMGASTSTKTRDGYTIIDFLAHNYYSVSSSLEKGLSLVRGGARLDKPLVSTGQSFLAWGVRFGNICFLDRILGIATPSNFGPSHLDQVINECLAFPWWVEACEVLVSHGAVLRDMDKAYSAATHLLAFSDGFDKADSLFNAILDMGLPMEKVFDLLTRALTLQNGVRATALLARVGYDLSNQPPCWLHLAVEWKHLKIIQRLLRGGANVNSLCEHLTTPLAEAIKEGSRDIIYVLLGYGADPFLPNNQPVCAGFGKDYERTHGISGTSAFEVGLHQGVELEIIKDMWRKTAPDARPKLDAFISCVPDGHPDLLEWLQQTKQDMEAKGKEH
ncbi:ankyrin [Hypoxylon sp. FL1857]|nr:ankyrin [Hypoxylon sp. FL1857]